ncbi:MAG: nuclear transport factor 2 family protein [Muribaculaceae bacterium]|nr:nuclear transport factor 2 family protein [Muribaculaceae bacterium]
MKKILSTLSLSIALAFTSCHCENSTENNMTNTNSVSPINATPTELDGIKKVLDAYVGAAIKGSSDIAKPVFAETATISYNENDSLVSNPIQALYDYYDQTGPHHAEYEITSAQVADNVAIVSIDSKFGDVRFDDMFTLVKDGNDWKIISKIYHVK